MWPIIISIIISGLTAAYSYYQQKKAMRGQSSSPEDQEVAMSEEGVSHKWIFGSPHVSPNFVWKGRERNKAIKKDKQVIGYKYYLSLQCMIGLMTDRLISISFENRDFLKGTDAAGADVVKSISFENLFGGEGVGGEGGVSGSFSFHNGQQLTADTHLVQHMSNLSPNYKGLTYLVFRDFYFGTTPYIKDIKFWMQRLYIQNSGLPQWYQGKVAIVVFDEENPMIPDIPVTRNFQVYQNGNPTLSDTTTVNSDIYNGRYFDDKYGAIQLTNGSTIQYGFNKDLNTNGKIFVEFELSTLFGENIDLFPIKISIPKAINLQKTEFPVGMSGYRGYKYSFYLDAKDPSNFNLSISIDTVLAGSQGFVIFYGLKSYTSFDGVDNVQMNPAHVLREILIDKNGMGYREQDVNDSSFTYAADILYDEKIGISTTWSQEQSIEEFKNKILDHINGTLRVNRQTGLFELKLFRDDYVFDDLPLYNESQIKNIDFPVSDIENLINKLNVTYYDRVNRKKGSFSIFDGGLIQTIGYENPQSVDYDFFYSKTTAEIMAQRLLKQLSTPYRKGKITLSDPSARNLNVGDEIVITFPKLKISSLVCRVLSISLPAKDGSVTIQASEIIPINGLNRGYTISDNFEPPSVYPTECEFYPIEIPYHFATQAIGLGSVDATISRYSGMGWVGSLAEQPPSISGYAEMWTQFGENPYAYKDDIEYTTSLSLASVATRQDTVFDFTDVDGDLSDLRQGDILLVGDELVMLKQAPDTVSETISVARGVYDTVPQEHIAGTKILLVNENTLGIDQQNYQNSSIINIKALPRSPTGVFPIDFVTAKPIEIKGRPARPYPAAFVRINGAVFPDEIQSDDDGFILIEWANRNRISQENSLSPIDWMSPIDISPETGVTYGFDMYDEDENLVISQAGITGTSQQIDVSMLLSGTYRIVFYSIRDGLRNYQDFNHLVTLLGDAFNVRFVFDPAEGYTPNTDFLL